MSRVAGTLPGQAGSRKDLQVPGAGPETARVARRLGVLPGAPGRRAGGRLSLLAAAFPLLQPPETPSLSVGGAAADRKSLTGEGTFQPSMVRRARVPQLEHGESGSQDDLRADLRRPWTSNLPPAVCPSHSQQEGSSAPPRPFRAAPQASDTQAGLPITQVDWTPGGSRWTNTCGLANHRQSLPSVGVPEGAASAFGQEWPLGRPECHRRVASGSWHAVAMEQTCVDCVISTPTPARLRGQRRAGPKDKGCISKNLCLFPVQNSDQGNRDRVCLFIP